MKAFDIAALRDFEDACAADLTTRTITDSFEDAGIARTSLQLGDLGIRRTIFRESIASIDQTKNDQLRKLVGALGAIFRIVAKSHSAEDRRATLEISITRCGYVFDTATQTLKANETTGVPFSATSTEDLRQIGEQAGDLYAMASSKPTVAIGAAKELIESVCKILLRLQGHEPPTGDLGVLVKATLKTLNLVADDVDCAKKGADSIRRCLQQLAAVTGTLAEIRNLYGSGHGRDGRWKGLSPRHARLTVGCAIAVSEFLAETYLER